MPAITRRRVRFQAQDVMKYVELLFGFDEGVMRHRRAIHIEQILGLGRRPPSPVRPVLYSGKKDETQLGKAATVPAAGVSPKKILEAGRRDDGKQGQGNDTVGFMPHGFFAILSNQAVGIGSLVGS